MSRPVTCRYCDFSWIHQTEEFQKKWKNDYSRCPDCGTLYCNLYPTEKQLMELQDIYLINYDAGILNEMCKILLSYCESLIKKKKIPYMTAERVIYLSQKAVAFFVENYLKDTKKEGKDFKIVKSFSGWLRHDINRATYEVIEKPLGDMSLNYEFDDGHQVEHKDENIKEDELTKIETNYDKLLVINHILDFIKEYDQYDHECEKYRAVAGLCLYLKYGQKKADDYYRIYGESVNRRNELEKKRCTKYNKKPKKKVGKIGKFQFLMLRDAIRNKLISFFE